MLYLASRTRCKPKMTQHGRGHRVQLQDRATRRDARAQLKLYQVSGPHSSG